MLKSDLQFLGGAYHFSALMCPLADATLIHQENLIYVPNLFRIFMGTYLFHLKTIFTVLTHILPFVCGVREFGCSRPFPFPIHVY